jgi:hypothetical protein
MERPEFRALLKELWAHIESPRYVYRHRWQLNDYVLWDNVVAACAHPLRSRREARCAPCRSTAPRRAIDGCVGRQAKETAMNVRTQRLAMAVAAALFAFAPLASAQPSATPGIPTASSLIVRIRRVRSIRWRAVAQRLTSSGRTRSSSRTSWRQCLSRR